MPESSTETALLRILDWAYGKATDGLPGFGSANDLAEDYLMRDGTLSENVNALIRWQNTKAGTSGFLTGLGGLIHPAGHGPREHLRRAARPGQDDCRHRHHGGVRCQG